MQYYFLKTRRRLKEIVATTSMRKIEDLKGWSPIMPICEKCGKIATTRVTSHTNDEYEYVCDVDVKYTKGCDFKGKAKITDHKYKLQWRLHWPSWQAIFNSSIEGSGLDHMTKGGSATTAPVIHKEILKQRPSNTLQVRIHTHRRQEIFKIKGNRHERGRT